MAYFAKFFYDLAGRPNPKPEELNEDIDRLLMIKSAEQPDYLEIMETKDQLSNLDSEVICYWIKRRVEPALLLMMLQSEDNYITAKDELCKMDSHKSILDKLFRPMLVRDHAMRRVRELCFENPQAMDMKKSVINLKKMLVFISEHLNATSPNNMTIQDTDAYTPADIALYNSLKRIVVGRYQDSGLKIHVRLCEPLKRFMAKFASKNRYVIDVSSNDPLTDSSSQPGLLNDSLKPAIVACAIILFFLWRKG